MQLFYQPEVPNGVNHLGDEESRHCTKVLRKHLHDPIDIVDGQGTFYKAFITDTNPRKVKFEIVQQIPDPPKAYYLHLAIAPTKRLERMEWLVEKATEIGVDRITFIQCAHSERPHIRPERLRRKAISAMKQSLKASLPKIEGIRPFEDLVKEVRSEPATNKYLAHLGDFSKPLTKLLPLNSRYCILIGPEGDFNQQEMEMAQAAGFIPAHLGKERLRTETAALTALISIQIMHF